MLDILMKLPTIGPALMSFSIGRRIWAKLNRIQNRDQMVKDLRNALKDGTMSQDEWVAFGRNLGVLKSKGKGV
jgi:hypothetical protein